MLDWWALACRVFTCNTRLRFRIPNDGKCGIREAFCFKRTGIRGGVPHLYLIEQLEAARARPIL